MTLRQLIALVFTATALLWGGWAWTIWTVDPSATNWIGFVLFYLIFFLATVGTLSILGIIIRHKREPDALVYHIVSVAFRQSFLLAGFAMLLLILQGQRWLRVWAVLIGFIVVVAVEAFIARRDVQTRARSTNKNREPLPSVSSYTASVNQPVFTKKDII